MNAEGYEISASEAYEAFSICEKCISEEDDSVCSDKVQGIIKCADIRDIFMKTRVATKIILNNVECGLPR